MQVFASAVLHLTTRLKAVVARRAGAAFALWGEAGIGKTYAAQAILGELTCYSFTFHSTLPLPSILCALPRPAKLPLWAAHSLERLARGEVLETSSTADALAALLGALAPVVLHLEDLHEAPAERAGLVVALAERAKRRRGVALLITSCQEPPQPFEACCLEPLPRAASDGLLEDEVGVPLPLEACAWIFAKAAGNPLYSLEFCRYLARAGFLWNDGGRWHWRNPPKDFLPPTVEALIEQLVMAAKRLEINRYVLETRALLPVEASHDLWLKTARVSPAELQTAIRNLVQQGVFNQRSFTHPLFKEVTLKTLTPERRQHLSRRAINALQDDPEQAALFVEDAALDDARALELFKAAAQQSKDSVRAARLQAQAANHAQGEEKGRLALEAARVLHHVNYPEATWLAELAVATLPKSAEAALLLAEIFALQGRVPEAEVALMNAHNEVSLQKRIHLRALATDHQGVLELWHEFGAETAIAADVAADVATAMIVHGDVSGAFALVKNALAMSCRDSQKSQLKGVLAEISYFQGRFEEAVTLWSERIAYLREVGPLAELTACLKKRAEAFQSLGLLQRKRVDLEEAIRLYSTLGDGQNFAATRTLLGVLLIEEEDFALAEEILLESREVLAHLGSWANLVNCERMLCYLYRQRVLPHGLMLALKYGRAALERTRKLASPPLLVNVLYELSYAETLGGFTQRGLALAEEGLMMSERLGYPQVSIYCRFDRAFALEKLDRLDEALCDYRVCLEEAKACGLEMDAQTIGLELDRIANDARSATRRLAWFEEHGHRRRAKLVLDYFPTLKEAPSLPKADRLPRLEGLGPLRFMNGVETQAVRGRKRNVLLALLLEARVSGRSEVPKLALLDTLYSGDDELKSGSSLKEIVHNLRDALGATMILTTTSGYALGECTSDVEQFLTSLDASLWRGLYLDGLELEESPVRESLYLALHRAAQDLLETDPKEAARVGKLLLEAEPYSVTYLRTYLCALRSLDNHRSLERQYQTAQTRLLEVGETLPPRWQDFLVIP